YKEDMEAWVTGLTRAINAHWMKRYRQCLKKGLPLPPPPSTSSNVNPSALARSVGQAEGQSGFKPVFFASDDQTVGLNDRSRKAFVRASRIVAGQDAYGVGGADVGPAGVERWRPDPGMPLVDALKMQLAMRPQVQHNTGTGGGALGIQGQVGRGAAVPGLHGQEGVVWAYNPYQQQPQTYAPMPGNSNAYTPTTPKRGLPHSHTAPPNVLSQIGREKSNLALGNMTVAEYIMRLRQQSQPRLEDQNTDQQQQQQVMPEVPPLPTPAAGSITTITTVTTIITKTPGDAPPTKTADDTSTAAPQIRRHTRSKSIGAEPISFPLSPETIITNAAAESPQNRRSFALPSYYYKQHSQMPPANANGAGEVPPVALPTTSAGRMSKTSFDKLNQGSNYSIYSSDDGDSMSIGGSTHSLNSLWALDDGGRHQQQGLWGGTMGSANRSSASISMPSLHSIKGIAPATAPTTISTTAADATALSQVNRSGADVVAGVFKDSELKPVAGDATIVRPQSTLLAVQKSGQQSRRQSAMSEGAQKVVSSVPTTRPFLSIPPPPKNAPPAYLQVFNTSAAPVAPPPPPPPPPAPQRPFSRVGIGDVALIQTRPLSSMSLMSPQLLITKPDNQKSTEKLDALMHSLAMAMEGNRESLAVSLKETQESSLMAALNESAAAVLGPSDVLDVKTETSSSTRTAEERDQSAKPLIKLHDHYQHEGEDASMSPASTTSSDIDRKKTIMVAGTPTFLKEHRQAASIIPSSATSTDMEKKKTIMVPGTPTFLKEYGQEGSMSPASATSTEIDRKKTIMVPSTLTFLKEQTQEISVSSPVSATSTDLNRAQTIMVASTPTFLKEHQLPPARHNSNGDLDVDKIENARTFANTFLSNVEIPSFDLHLIHPDGQFALPWLREQQPSSSIKDEAFTGSETLHKGLKFDPLGAESKDGGEEIIVPDANKTRSEGSSRNVGNEQEVDRQEKRKTNIPFRPRTAHSTSPPGSNNSSQEFEEDRRGSTATLGNRASVVSVVQAPSEISSLYQIINEFPYLLHYENISTDDLTQLIGKTSELVIRCVTLHDRLETAEKRMFKITSPQPFYAAARSRQMSARQKCLDEYRDSVRDFSRRAMDYVQRTVIGAGIMGKSELEGYPGWGLVQQEGKRGVVNLTVDSSPTSLRGELLESVKVMKMKIAQVRELFDIQ
ncbi:hypothetical protein HK102_008085, partial [Quaeritorhiza haematococci]